MKETFIAFLGKTLNLPADRLSEILFKKSEDGALTDELQDGALDALVKLDAERAAKLKGDAKSVRDEGYKRGHAEVSEKWEKAIREKFGIADTDATGEDLISVALEKVSKVPKLEDDKVKAHPLYMQLERQYQTDLKAAKEAGEKLLSEFKTGVERQARLASVQQEAKKVFLSRKPVLSSDPVKQENQVEMFLSRFSQFDWEPLDGGGWLPMKDGKRIENEHGHPVDLQTLVSQTAEQYFDFQVQDPKGNAGNKNEPGKTGSAGPAKVPTNEAELWAAYNAAQTPEQKKEIMAAFERANGVIEV